MLIVLEYDRKGSRFEKKNRIGLLYEKLPDNLLFERDNYLLKTEVRFLDKLNKAKYLCFW